MKKPASQEIGVNESKSLTVDYCRFFFLFVKGIYIITGIDNCSSVDQLFFQFKPQQKRDF